MHGFIDSIATSICDASGSLVVSFCSHNPGFESHATHLLVLLPANFIISYEIPATAGKSARRIKTRNITISTLGKSAKSKILTIITKSKKLVPHLG